MAYVGDTARLCQAIVDGDLEHVQDWCSQEGVDVNRRDYTGRTPLHLAVMASTLEIVNCLIDNGARLIARLVDGRTALHIAAARGDIGMVKALMDKSLANEEEEDEKEEGRRMAKKAERSSQTHANEISADRKVSTTDDDDNSDGESAPSEITLDSDDEKDDVMTMGSFVKVTSEASANKGKGEVSLIRFSNMRILTC
jgi:ankyrin repeat protein